MLLFVPPGLEMKNELLKRRHHGESDSDVDDDPANDYNQTDNENEIEDINPKRNAVIRQIGK